ncbi:MAG: DUF5615 family PIN-like protein [Desulfurococcales archaeon]|nr:DUF5615 family PIN-like protein [Desulfurococcales archaeon]
MRSKLLADENVPWPLIKLLRNTGIDIVWIPETEHRGISDREIIDLANSSGRIILTRDSDFLRISLRRRMDYELVYIAEPVKKDNIKKLIKNIVKALELLDRKGLMATVTSTTIELYPLIP